MESYDTEKEVLLAWTDFIHTLDPDIITGYNILGFDFYYMYERAILFGIEKEFGELGRLDHNAYSQYIKIRLISKIVEKKLSSAALVDNVLKNLPMIGRINIDMLSFVRRTLKLKSY